MLRAIIMLPSCYAAGCRCQRLPAQAVPPADTYTILRGAGAAMMRGHNIAPEELASASAERAATPRHDAAMLPAPLDADASARCFAACHIAAACRFISLMLALAAMLPPCRMLFRYYA